MESVVSVDTKFWLNKRVLVTGHTGFKGSWLTLLLTTLGSEVTGLSISELSGPSLYERAGIRELCSELEVDITKLGTGSESLYGKHFDYVFHLAAEPLVRLSYARPVETFDTNLMGTVRLLEQCRFIRDLRGIVVITTDKVYRNSEDGSAFTEDDPLGGHDPYSSSKAAVELAVDCYRGSFFNALGINVASCRAGNVLGGGDWGADRLVPDALRAWSSGSRLEIRNPTAVRPWQHVLDVLFGYLAVAQAIFDDRQAGRAWNIGPSVQDSHWTVLEVVRELQDLLPGLQIQVENVFGGLHEARELVLNSADIKQILGHSPVLRVNEALEWTANWYRDFNNGGNARQLCGDQIAKYVTRYYEK